MLTFLFLTETGTWGQMLTIRLKKCCNRFADMMFFLFNQETAKKESVLFYNILSQNLQKLCLLYFQNISQFCSVPWRMPSARNVKSYSEQRPIYFRETIQSKIEP